MRVHRHFQGIGTLLEELLEVLFLRKIVLLGWLAVTLESCVLRRAGTRRLDEVGEWFLGFKRIRGSSFVLELGVIETVGSLLAENFAFDQLALDFDFLALDDGLRIDDVLVFGACVDGVGDIPLELFGGPVQADPLVRHHEVVLLAIEQSDLGICLGGFVSRFLKRALVNSICLIPLFSFGLFG